MRGISNPRIRNDSLRINITEGGMSVEEKQNSIKSYAVKWKITSVVRLILVGCIFYRKTLVLVACIF